MSEVVMVDEVYDLTFEVTVTSDGDVAEATFNVCRPGAFRW